ncbi:MAG: antA/AntB antirepressor family protein [Ruminococcus sp.]|nr:antA/AntB antirepressor family protein [Ruminococcus sp.]MCM1382789.1 antA/AntB antirepressor family protein [Muribaculaceae bacterium]MCM1480883.1 antA/AntB antirepressor family protein [Muribaculaceae bacterium]
MNNEMNELIKINCDSDQPTVFGRDLHKALSIRTPYTQWFERMKEYGFAENSDFVTLRKNAEHTDGSKMSDELTDHQITIEMAKEICMIQRSKKGKQCRQYFIDAEKRFNNPQAVIARALRVADEELKRLHITVSQLTVDNQIMQPKAEYFDELVERSLLTSFRETAKQFGIKERAFIQFLIDKKYIYKDQMGKLMPYADKNDGLFEVRECFNEKTQWNGAQTLVTPKGRETFRLLYVRTGLLKI